VFYFVPGLKYEYSAAVRARDSAPFHGVWFCGGFPQPPESAADSSDRNSVLKTVFAAAAKRAAKGGGAACASVEAMAALRCASGQRVLISPEEERDKYVAHPYFRAFFSLTGTAIVSS
jgi:hypothetical protein